MAKTRKNLFQEIRKLADKGQDLMKRVKVAASQDDEPAMMKAMGELSDVNLLLTRYTSDVVLLTYDPIEDYG